VHCHIIDKMTWAVIGKNISWYFNRVIDTLKITALSNHKPGILNNYIRIKNLLLWNHWTICKQRLFIMWLLTKFLVLIINSTWLPTIQFDWLNVHKIFSETTLKIKLWYCRNVPYRVFYFFWGFDNYAKPKMATTTKFSST